MGKKSEFINLVRLYQKKAGLESQVDKNSILPLDHFKECLKALGITMDDKVSKILQPLCEIQDLRKFYAKVPSPTAASDMSFLASELSSIRSRVSSTTPQRRNLLRTMQTTQTGQRKGSAVVTADQQQRNGRAFNDQGKQGIDAYQFVSAYC